MSWHPLLLSLRATAVATLLMVAVGLPLSLLFARRQFPGKTVAETLVNLPLVLPPTVVGYYLLLVLGRGGPLVEWLNVSLLFTWGAVVIASAIVGLPLMVGAARAAIAEIDPALENAARTLGSSELEVLWRVTLPLARRGILAGLVLGATRALGEFGATLMVAGNIPGKTQTLSLAVYDAVQAGQDDLANFLVVITSIVCVLILVASGKLFRPAY
jgi:molybdate transport system permease protein